MTEFHDSEYWQNELKLLLEAQEPENLHLDYKGRESLMPAGRGGSRIDKQKRSEDVGKDVTAFLNSDGGTIIYGVPETEDPTATDGAPVPTGNSGNVGFSRGEMDKETIENLITSSIQPKLGADLFQITEVSFDERMVFVVEIGVGIGDVWQAKDKKYYRRFHYKAEPMEHYEVNMVRSRSLGPTLKMVFGFDERWATSVIKDDVEEVAIFLGIRNDADTVAETALLELGIPKANVFPGDAPEEVGPFTRGRDSQGAWHQQR